MTDSNSRAETHDTTGLLNDMTAAVNDGDLSEPQHRRLALEGGSAAELASHRWMHRSMLALWMHGLYLDRAEFQESCLWNKEGTAYALVCIRAGLNRYRADAWGHIADSQKRRAQGLQPDPDAIADLRHCRVRITELNAEYPAALAAADSNVEAQKSEEPLNDAAAHACFDIGVAKVDHVDAFVLSVAGTTASYALSDFDDVPF